MANYSINTCFRLDWPKKACDSLKQAINCVSKEVSVDAPEFQTLGSETRKIVQRLLESYEPLGVNVIDHQDGGVVVTDEDGMFAPQMAADLLSAIMKDHDIREIVSFSWSEDCDKHRINAFSGGGAVVSAEDARFFHIFDWIENAAREMREDMEERPPEP